MKHQHNIGNIVANTVIVTLLILGVMCFLYLLIDFAVRYDVPSMMRGMNIRTRYFLSKQIKGVISVSHKVDSYNRRQTFTIKDLTAIVNRDYNESARPV